MILCNSCCQQKQSLDPNTEPAFIDEELTRIGAQINRLLVVQAGLLRHRNRHRSPIYTLPPELLITIFLLACTSGRDLWEKFGTHTSQVVVLSSVSSYWRQVVFETPSLWNTVALVVKGKTALLQHHLIHAKNLDLSLDLILGGRNEMTDAQQSQMSNILFNPENAQKVTTLRVQNLPGGWLAKFSQLPRLHTLVLKDLQSEDNTPSPLTLDLHTQPLHRLFISFNNDDIHLESVNLPSSVQELLTCGIASNVLLESLRQCPNLTKVVNTDPPDDIEFTTPLTLGRLETFTWPAGFLDSTSITDLSLPALKHLRLEAGDHSSRIPVTAFCHQLSQTLTSLELHWFDSWSTRDFRQLFRHKLERLEILKLTEWPLSELVIVTRVLTPSDEEFCRNKLPTLPSLQTLVLKAEPLARDGDDDSDDSDDSDSDLAAVYDVLPRCSEDHTPTDNIIFLFLQLLSNRGAGERTTFRLDLPVWSSKRALKWSDRHQEIYTHTLAARSIELLQDGQVLEWFVRNFDTNVDLSTMFGSPSSKDYDSS